MPDQRTVFLIDGLVDRIREFVRDERVTYPEYYAALRYLMELDNAGEALLLAAVFFQSTVDSINRDDGVATSSGFEGSHYRPDAPWLEHPYTLPMRPDEPGERLFFHGRVESVNGTALAGATVDVWQSDADGQYSFGQQMPEGYLFRGRLRTDAAGEFDIRTIRPVPYQIPHKGPVGDLLENVMGRHTWRSAHLHVKVEADGHIALNTQVFFPDDPYLDSDCLTAVKPSLVMGLTKTDADSGSYRGDYVFRLSPA